MKSVKELMDMKGRVALVTGGSGHLGAAMAGALAELGAGICVLDIAQERCGAVAVELERQHGVATLPLAVDLSDALAVRRVPSIVTEHFGRLDVVVHCAAYTGDTSVPGWAVPFDEQSVEAWDRALRVNTTSAFVLVQAAAQALRESGHGNVVFISSIYGLMGPDMRLYEGTGMNNAAGYAASKGGLLQLMRYLSTLLAPDVRVNAISPGGVWRNQPEAFHERYKARTPLGRMATEEDFKGAIAYLASDLSAYVTGHNLLVDGGWTAW
jgi:NAD(P)-dependent dehydrogenase (short-subunit alcohol dehydrogenase family)